jgi:hypothetical protein
MAGSRVVLPCTVPGETERTQFLTMRTHHNPQQLLMIRLEGDSRAIRRSVVSDKKAFQIGDRLRVDFLGGWPMFEIVGRDDGALVVRRYEAPADGPDDSVARPDRPPVVRTPGSH